MSVTETLLVEPDLEFKRRILGLGADDLTTCYQCGTCSVVCPISTAANPFPRKEMVWVQWGLKDLALSNASIWLCHQCAACTAYCPRNAKPADLMAALRDYSITHYAFPRFMGPALNHPRYLAPLLAVPVLIFAAILAWLGNLTALPQGDVVFSKFMPILYVEATFMAALALSIGGAFISGGRYWRAMAAQGGEWRVSWPHVAKTMRNILSHRKFKDCGGSERTTGKEHLHKTHLLVFYAFLGLVVTTTSVGIGIYAFGYLTPWPFWHPVKILGNLSGIGLIAGCALFSYRRITEQQRAGKNTYSDMLFLTVLLATAITGYLCESLRLAAIRELAYPMYYVHLVSVFFLLVYFPYSKLSHVIYRTLAMVRESAAPQN